MPSFFLNVPLFFCYTLLAQRDSLWISGSLSKISIYSHEDQNNKMGFGKVDLLTKHWVDQQYTKHLAWTLSLLISPFLSSPFVDISLYLRFSLVSHYLSLIALTLEKKKNLKETDMILWLTIQSSLPPTSPSLSLSPSLCFSPPRKQIFGGGLCSQMERPYKSILQSFTASFCLFRPLSALSSPQTRSATTHQARSHLY